MTAANEFLSAELRSIENAHVPWQIIISPKIKCWNFYLAFENAFSHVCHAECIPTILCCWKETTEKWNIFHNNNPFNWDRLCGRNEITDMWFEIGPPMKRLFCFVVGFVVNQIERVTVAVIISNRFPSYTDNCIDRKRLIPLNRIRWKYKFHIYRYFIPFVINQIKSIVFVPWYTGKTTAASFYSFLLLHIHIFTGLNIEYVTTYRDRMTRKQ